MRLLQFKPTDHPFVTEPGIKNGILARGRTICNYKETVAAKYIGTFIRKSNHPPTKNRTNEIGDFSSITFQIKIPIHAILYLAWSLRLNLYAREHPT